MANIIFLHTWYPFAAGLIKGCFYNLDTNKFIRLKDGSIVNFFNEQKIKEQGIKIYYGKKRNEILNRHNMMVDPETKLIRKRKR